MMKLTKREDLLLRSIEDCLEEYRRKEMDGMVIYSIMNTIDNFDDVLSSDALYIVLNNEDVAKA